MRGRAGANFIFCNPVSRQAEAYTEFVPASVGTFQEQHHGQTKAKQQGREEATSPDPEGKAGSETGEEARERLRAADSALSGKAGEAGEFCTEINAFYS
ncbi:hypothetical protein [Azoarcus sp. KH32C]|uniref:hypothetical protein n=1 Tax=Azoarcus sp. KH32C TaxID=748247 RepID=UPI00155AEB09|nr:hypothetical protein [Azoarcus sp. KH32C]